MKLFRYAMFILVFTFSILSAEDLPKYKMIDLGVFGTDQSNAIAINEKGQVLGSCEEGGCRYIFLWDELNGLKLIDLPEGCNYWELKLNNNGQIAGVGYLDSSLKAFLWDQNLGFWELETSKDEIEIAAFNDKGQVLGRIGDEIFLWDHGKKTDMTGMFREMIPGKWDSFQAVALNNHGHLVLNANTTPQDIWVQRSFLWKDGSFKMILPEKGWETSTQVVAFDDDGNMVIALYNRRGGEGGQYFISQARNIFAPCQRVDSIRNGLPIAKDCLPGKLKKDGQGKSYFSNGIQIKKLFKDEFPYYNFPNSTVIRDQNSKGYVVGQIDTMFPGSHAFLAIPQLTNEK